MKTKTAFRPGIIAQVTYGKWLQSHNSYPYAYNQWHLIAGYKITHADAFDGHGLTVIVK